MPAQRIGDIDLHYETTGEGEPLLFIHGLGSSARDWELQVAFFSPDYRVVTYDVRGHGRSYKPPGPYSVQLFADDAAELIRSLDNAPAHIVGISMGGMIAFQLAVDAPELVKSLVIVNSAPELILHTFKERLQFFQRLMIVRLLGMRKMGEVLSARLLPKTEHQDLRREFVERWVQNDKQAYLDSLRALVGWSVSEHLSEINVPTLVVAADEDYSPVSVKETYVARMPRAELVVIPDSRHATPVEQPEALNRAVAAFLARCEG